MRRSLLVVGVIALAGAAVAGLWYAAANGALTGPIIRRLGHELGREVTVDGAIRVRVGPVTRITADGLHLANASWGTRPDMLAVRSIAIEFDTRTLFDHTLVVRAMHVEGAGLLLERTADGRSNWDLDRRRDDEREPGKLPLVIERLSAPGARVRFVGPPFEQPLDVVIDGARQASSGDGMLRLVARGMAGDTPLELQVHAGPLAGLVEGRDVRFRASGRIGEVTLDAAGHVDAFQRPADTEIRLDLSGPDAAYVTERLGVRHLGNGPFSLEAVVMPAPGGSGLRGQLSGRLGGFDIASRGYVDTRVALPAFGVQARVSGPDLSLAGDIAGVGKLPAESFSLRLDAERREGTLRVRAGELDVGGARARFSGVMGREARGDERLEFAIEQADFARIGGWAGFSGWPSGRTDASGRAGPLLENGLVLLLEAHTPIGRIRADGVVGAGPQLSGTTARIEGEGADFRPLGRLLGWSDAPAAGFQVRGNLAWREAGVVLDGVRLKVGGDELQLDGAIGRPLASPATKLRFQLDGADARLAGRYVGIDRLPAIRYRVAGRLRRQKTATVLDEVEARLAGATLRLDGPLGDAPGHGGTRLRFSAQGPALERLAALAPGYPLPRGAFQAAGTLERTGAQVGLHQVTVAAGGAQGTVTAEFPLPLQSATIRFDADVRGPDLALLLTELRETPGAGRNFRLQVKGARQPGRWSFERLVLTTDDGSLDAVGDMALTPHFNTNLLAVDARTSSLSAVGRMFGRQWPDQPLTLRARLSGNGEDFDAEQLRIKLGASDVSGRMAVRTHGKVRDLDLRLESTLLDLRPYWHAPWQQSVPSKKRRGDKTRLIPPMKLTLAAFDGYTGTLGLSARELRAGEERFLDLRLTGKLAKRSLRIDPLSLGGDAGDISARIEIEEGQQGVIAGIAGTATNLALAPIPTGARGPNASRYEARFDLRGRGHDLRELASTLDGGMRLVGRGGRIANSRLLATTDDFITQLLSSLNPMTTRQPTTDVVCVAYLFRAQDGRLTTDPVMVLQTTELDIISHGSVDLRTEQVDFNFKTAARKGIGIGIAQFVNPYVKVNGTLAFPGLTLDPRGAVVNGGAAFATAGLSIVATTAWDRVFREKDPCGAITAVVGGNGESPTAKRPWWRRMPLP
ncbi:MAG: AsmA family protein [Gammaproteobacteria bacterium]|nr:AsmA family protein [Gammaproteobacteria bacterium]